MLRYECGKNPFEMRRNTILDFIDKHTYAYVGEEHKAEIEEMADEIMSRGMKCLTEQMGIVEAEQFISVIIREKFDYTKWQRDYFDAKSPEEIREEASQFEKAHPFTGNAIRL